MLIELLLFIKQIGIGEIGLLLANQPQRSPSQGRLFSYVELAKNKRLVRSDTATAP